MASEQAIQRTIDELEIRNIIARLAMLTDSGDLDEYASVFSENANLELRPPPGQPSVVPPTKGRAAVLAGARKRRADGMTGPGTGVVHAIQASAVSVTGDTATARSYVVLYRNANALPEAMAMMIYNDEFTRTSEGWKLAVRFIDPV